ncbi:MAG: hypothetical protein WAV47_22785 [Blastocatellia bacterium]
MVKPGSANNLSGQPPLAVPMGSALGDAASDLLSGYAAKRLRRPLCRSAPPSETPPAIFLAATPPSVPMGSAHGDAASDLFRGYAAHCADGLCPRDQPARKPTAATPPTVPMGFALGTSRSASLPRLRRCRLDKFASTI